jgi:endonuclease/exonuclease/phosphatase family metal-dependent hydrolase
MLAKLVEGEREPAVVLGDFNSGEANPAYRRLTSPRAGAGPLLRDTYRLLHPGDSIVGTFNGFRADSTGEKIDHVLVTRGWRVVDAGILRTSRNGRYPSDHFPVTATIRLE